MQIFLRGKMTYVINVEKSSTVLHIKKLIFEKEQIPPQFLLLTCKAKCLEDGNTLEYYGVDRDDTIYFRVRAFTSCDSPVPE